MNHFFHSVKGGLGAPNAELPRPAAERAADGERMGVGVV
jgi:hypothetical protein